MNIRQLAFLPIALLVLMAAPLSSTAQRSEFPMMEKLAQKVIDKYQNSSCADLKAKKEEPHEAQQAAMKEKVVGMLKSNPQMREQFLNRVAGPIANKMFECGMIP
jgi:hypothetical protein